MANLKYYHSITMDGTNGKSSHNSCCTHQDSNQLDPEYQTEILVLSQPAWCTQCCASTSHKQKVPMDVDLSILIYKEAYTQTRRSGRK